MPGVWLEAWRRALELNPNSVVALRLSAEHLIFTGRFEEGLAQARRARDLDPLSQSVNLGLAYASMRARHYDEAIAQYRRMLELDPTLGAPRYHLSWIYMFKGMHAEALAECNRLGADAAPWLGYLYARMGRRDDARRLADGVKRLSTQRYMDAYRVAITYTGLGYKDQAFAWLEKAYQDRSTFMAQLKVEAFFDPLRSDPRFQDLLRRMNFPPLCGTEAKVDAVVQEVLRAQAQHALNGVTFSGGEPMQQAHSLLRLVQCLHQQAPELSFGMFSGYAEQELAKGQYRIFGDGSSELCRKRLWQEIRGCLDFAILGRFNQAQPSSLPLRTSRNQVLRPFSDRYSPSDFSVQLTEVSIAAGGRVEVTGFPTLGLPW